MVPSWSLEGPDVDQAVCSHFTRLLSTASFVTTLVVVNWEEGHTAPFPPKQGGAENPVGVLGMKALKGCWETLVASKSCPWQVSH